MNNGSPLLMSLNVQHEIVDLKKSLSLTLEFLRILMNFSKKKLKDHKLILMCIKSTA